ncbi:MAG: hypothetical protein ACKOAF_05020 [Actinomycetes bacterium]
MSDNTTPSHNCGICQTPTHHTNCCPKCLTRLHTNLNTIEQHVHHPTTQPTSHTHTTPTYESRPPTNLTLIDPHLATYNLNGQPTTITETLESWSRLIRELRHMAPYGPATAPHWNPNEHTNTARTFTHSLATIRTNLPWATSHPDFPLQDLHDELTHTARAARRFSDHTHTNAKRINCPTLDCTGIIHLTTWQPLDHDPTTGETTTCRRCGAVRTATQLLAAAGTDDTYADAEALAAHFGTTPRTIQRWGATRKIRTRDSRYNWADVKHLTQKGTTA